MRLLCLDLGERRIGLAVGDTDSTIATPAGFLERTGLQRDIARILEMAESRQAQGIVVGMPLSLNGRVGPQAKRVLGFLRALKTKTDLLVETMDERYSTAEAQRVLSLAGRHPSRNKGDLDAAAATVILQEYLDIQRSQRCS